MEAYLKIYQNVVELGLRTQLKEEQDAQDVRDSQLTSSAKEEEPMKIIPTSFEAPFPVLAVPSAAPKQLPKAIAEPPPNHDAPGLILADVEAMDQLPMGPAPPPGLRPPPGLEAPLGDVPEDPKHREMLERARTSHPLTASLEQASFTKKAVPVGLSMMELDKTPDGTTPHQWTVDARKLKTSDKIIVSPSFERPRDGASAAKFKLMILPKSVDEKRGGSSFRKAKGRAMVQVKCEANPPEKKVKLRLSVTDKDNTKQLRPWCGPLVHNFSEANICIISELWDLPFGTDEPTFLVVVEFYDEDDVSA